MMTNEATLTDLVTLEDFKVCICTLPVLEPELIAMGIRVFKKALVEALQAIPS